MNRRSLLVGLSIIAHLLSASITVFSWSYDDIAAWAKEPGQCADTTGQSPIDLRPALADSVSFEPLTFHNYENPLAYTAYEIMNNGHTVVTSFANNSGLPIRISGAGLGDKVFAFQQFHFHWGNSEHAVNGDHYNMEIHIVHYNTTYPDFDAAFNGPLGLMSLTVFVLIGENDHPVFDKILEILKNITYQGQEAEYLHKFAIRDLLPTNTLDFYRYHGSQTVPPCTPNVIWTLLRKPIYISLRQMTAFKQLHAEKPHTTEEDKDYLLSITHRPIQPTGGRTVQRSFQIGQDWYYDDPASWSQYYPMCNGLSQSPIDITSSTSKPAATVALTAAPLTFTGFSSSKSLTLVNTGLTVEGRLGTSSGVILTGGVLAKGVRYHLYLVYFHFSLSSDTARGSEHSIDGTSYPLEIQLLFYNDKYSDSSVAERHSDGLAGLVIFGQIKDGATRIPILENVDKIKNIGSQYILANFQGGSLLPADCCNNVASDKSTEDWKHEYYSYNGSLTTPSCQQSVLWTVLPQPVYLPKDQMTALRSVNLTLSKTSTAPVSNSRPAQKINGRTVLLYTQHHSSANRLSNNGSYFLFLFAAVLLFKLR